MFGCHGKWYFPENDFWLTNIFTFDPEMIFHPHFHFKSFAEKEREREREKREPRSRRSSIDDCDRWDRAARSTSALDNRAPLVGRSHRPRLRSMSPSPRDLIFSSAGFDSFSFSAFCFFCRIWCIFYKIVWMNQTPKLIFRKTNFVTAKHMKTFSFPKNSISEK